MVLNAAQIHLSLNHFPVVLAVVSLPFLAWGLFRGSELSRKTGLMLALLAAVTAVPAFLTGEPAEEVVERLGASDALVHEHEEAAEAALVAVLAFGSLAAAAWFAAARAFAGRVSFSSRACSREPCRRRCWPGRLT